MNNMNTGIRNGHICADPVLKQAGSSQVVNFTLAVNTSYKSKSGELVKSAAFLPCEAWGKTAETISKWFLKGDPITIRESVRMDEWEDKTTKEKRTKLMFRVEEFWFETGYDYGEHQWSERKPKAAKPEQASKSEDVPPDDGGEDNIPF